MVKEKRNGQRIFVAPTEPLGDDENGAYKTYSNAIQFMPVTESE